METGSPAPATCAHARLAVTRANLNADDRPSGQSYDLVCLDCLAEECVTLRAFQGLRDVGRIVKVD